MVERLEQVQALLKEYGLINQMLCARPLLLEKRRATWHSVTGEVMEFLRYIRQASDADPKQRQSAEYWLDQGQGHLLLSGLKLIQQSLLYEWELIKSGKLAT